MISLLEISMFKFPVIKRWIGGALIPLFGIGLLVFSFSNIVQVYQLLNSPLDASSPAEIENPPAGAGVEFLPALVPSELEEVEAAPEMARFLPHQDIQVLEHRVRLAIRGELTPAEAFIKPMLVPERLVVDALGIDHPVIPVEAVEIEFQGETYRQWAAPRSGNLGWHSTSALTGAVGNTVINGHSSGYGETFRDLDTLENGDLIQVYAGDVVFNYTVANVMVLKERWEPIEVRMENARWINPSRDERLTLISCWPYDSNTHRVVVVALPMGYQDLPDARADQPREQVRLP